MDQSEHILVVDDDGPVRDVIVAILEDSNYRVSYIENDASMRDFLNTGDAIDCVVLDVIALGETSLSLALHLKEVGIPVTMISGNHDAKRYAEKNNIPLLQRPFHAHELYDAVDTALGRAGAIRLVTKTPGAAMPLHKPKRARPKSMISAEGSRTLEEAIVDTVREPLIVLDETLRVVVASRSFYQQFRTARRETEGRPLYELGNGQWNIPALRTLLEEIIPDYTTIEEYEVEHDFPTIGRRTMLLNARKIFYEGNNSTSLLVAIEDVAGRRTLEREKDELLRQKDLLLQEMNHRVNNSLDIIASILLLKAQTVQSEDTRRHLQDAHERVMAVATVQEQLHLSPFGTAIEARTYLTRLCESLVASMISESQPVSLRVESDDGATTSEQAVSMGLIATELVINSLKHAFPGGSTGVIVVQFEFERERVASLRLG